MAQTRSRVKVVLYISTSFFVYAYKNFEIHARKKEQMIKKHGRTSAVYSALNYQYMTDPLIFATL